MRRIFALLLVTPLLASCSDATTPVAPSRAVHPAMDMATDESWPVEENWLTPGDVLAVEGDLSATEVSPLQGAPATGEVMEFGNPDAGTPYPPGAHDQSSHARDRINPNSVVIDAGQTVTFNMNFGHRVAIYDEGVQANDIPDSGTGIFVQYPVHRLLIQPVPVPQFKVKFFRPGKFLVICAYRSHFFGNNMWGWIIVR